MPPVKNPIKGFRFLLWKQGSLKHIAFLVMWRTTRDKCVTYFGFRPKWKKKEEILPVYGENYVSVLIPYGLTPKTTLSTTEAQRNRAEPEKFDLSPGSIQTASFLESALERPE